MPFDLSQYEDQPKSGGFDLSQYEDGSGFDLSQFESPTPAHPVHQALLDAGPIDFGPSEETSIPLPATGPMDLSQFGSTSTPSRAPNVPVRTSNAGPPIPSPDQMPWTGGFVDLARGKGLPPAPEWLSGAGQHVLGLAAGMAQFPIGQGINPAQVPEMIQSGKGQFDQMKNLLYDFTHADPTKPDYDPEASKRIVNGGWVDIVGTGLMAAGLLHGAMGAKNLASLKSGVVPEELASQARVGESPNPTSLRSEIPSQSGIIPPQTEAPPLGPTDVQGPPISKNMRFELDRQSAVRQREASLSAAQDAADNSGLTVEKSDRSEAIYVSDPDSGVRIRVADHATVFPRSSRHVSFDVRLRSNVPELQEIPSDGISPPLVRVPVDYTPDQIQQVVAGVIDRIRRSPSAMASQARAGEVGAKQPLSAEGVKAPEAPTASPAEIPQGSPSPATGPGMMYAHSGMTFDDIVKSVKDVTGMAREHLGRPEATAGEMLDRFIRHHETYRQLMFDAEHSLPQIFDKVLGVMNEKGQWEISPETGRAIVDFFQDPSLKRDPHRVFGSDYHRAINMMEDLMGPLDEAFGRTGVKRADLPKGIRYLNQIYIDPVTGKPFKGSFGKFSRWSPSMFSRARNEFGEIKWPTYADARAAGMQQAYSNPGKIIGEYAKGIIQALETRDMWGILQGTPLKGEGGVGPQITTKHGVGDLHYVEDWYRLQGGKSPEMDNYQRFEFQGVPYGIHESIAPYVKSYMTYGDTGILMKGLRAAIDTKLAFSLFHPISLGINTALAGATKGIWHIPEGLRWIKEGGSQIRELVKAGSDVFRPTDVTPLDGNILAQWTQQLGERIGLPKIGVGVSKIFTISHEFIFGYVRPGLKAWYQVTKYDQLLPKYLEEGLGKEKCARDVVKMSDNLFSGGDAIRDMLESSRILAETIYSPAGRKAISAALISPSWQKAHFGMVSDIGEAFYRFSQGKATPMDAERVGYLMRAVGTYAAMNLMNRLMTKEMDGEAKWMWQNPPGKTLSIRMPWQEPDPAMKNGRRSYMAPAKSMFEIPGLAIDAAHADAGKFLSKLNPVWMSLAKSAVDLSQGMNQKAAGEILPAFVPIGVSSLKRQGLSPQSRTISTIGIPVGPGYSAAEQFVREYNMKRNPIGERSAEEEQDTEFKRNIRNDLARGDQTTLKEAIHAHKLNDAEILSLQRFSKMPPLARSMTSLPLDIAIKAYDLATPDERKEIRTLMLTKMDNFLTNASREDRDKLLKRIREVRTEYKLR